MIHDGVVIKPEQLHSKYKAWIIQNHRFDTDAVVQESSAVIIAQPHHKEELNIKTDGEKPCTSRENPFLQPMYMLTEECLIGNSLFCWFAFVPD